MQLGTDFFDTVVKLVQLGGLGVGALIFLFVFILLFRNQPVDAPTAHLRGRFLYLGTAFAVLALAASLLQVVLVRPAATAGSLVVTYSPKLRSAGLPTPDMVLLGSGTPQPVAEDAQIAITSGATLKISADDLIDQARKVKSAQEIAKTLVAANTVTSAPAPTPAPDIAASPSPLPTVAAPDVSIRDLRQLKQLQTSTATSLARGDFVAAERTSRQLRVRIEAVAPGTIAAQRVTDR